MKYKSEFRFVYLKRDRLLKTQAQTSTYEKTLKVQQGGGNIDYNYTVEVPSKSRANIFSWVELKSFHNEESPAKVFSWVQHQSFNNQQSRVKVFSWVHHQSFHKSVFFQYSNFLFVSCFCTYRSRTVARLNSFAPEQSNLRISWKSAKSLKNFVNS